MINGNIKLVHWILNRVLSTLLQESNNTDPAKTDLLCKAQVSSEEYYKILQVYKI